MNRIRLKSGYLFDPKSNIIPSLEDIAWGLSNICRWNGHANIWNSVAEHSVRVARLIREKGGSKEAIFQGLLHDASETIFGDIPSPLRELEETENYDFLINKLQVRIYRYYNLPLMELPEVIRADIEIREWEYENYVIGSKESWSLEVARREFYDEFESGQGYESILEMGGR